MLEHFTSDEKEGGTIDDGSTGSNNNTLDNNPRNNNHDDDLYSRLQTRLVNDIPELLIVNWSVWIPSMAFMFAFVPNKFQVLFSNCIGFGWNAYLSWRTHEGEAIIDAEEKEED